MKTKSTYYTGGMRLMRDGIPCKVASWVADLSPRSRAEFGRCGHDDISASKALRETGAAIRYSETTYVLNNAKQSLSIAAE